MSVGVVKSLTTVNGLVSVATGGTVDSADMTATAVAPGSYTSTNLTVDAAGRITAAASAPSRIVASADLTGQTGAVSSVATTTPGANGTYRVGVYATITAVALDVLNVQVDYTDETNTARTQTFVPVGLTSPNLSAVGASVFPTLDIRAKSGVAITIKTTLVTGTGSITYDVGGTIEYLR